ncbi:MAG TPA: HAD family hydrolase [Streptosporangiaceae bacterium]|nr:HAD family hydrolase [Streptosporangiaceae bacterium]
MDKSPDPADRGGRLAAVTAVFFDVGNTLIDESTEYGAWADWLGVPRHTFSAAFGAVIAQGGDYRDVFQRFRPGFDLDAERRHRLDAGLGEYFNARDLYPDARPCLAALKDHGYFVGLAGNQTARAGRLLGELNLPVDLIATSEDWGAAKPSPGFFEKLISSAGRSPARILYVGDRLDVDVLPAHQAGLVTGLIRRGPWGYVFPRSPDSAIADLRINSLDELPGSLALSIGNQPC